MEPKKDKEKRSFLFKGKKIRGKASSIKKPSIKSKADPGQESSTQRATWSTQCWPGRAPRDDRVEDEIVPEQKPETKSEATQKPRSPIKMISKIKVNKASKEQEESWSSVCPPGDKDAETKTWSKETLENSGDREMKHFHRYLRTADKSKDGFKPIKQIRSEGADRSDTVDSMVQMYPKKIRVVTEKISEKINSNKENELHSQVSKSLDNSGDKESNYFHWFSQTAEESKDGFKPMKKKDSEGADRSDTADSMVQMYSTNTKEVTNIISKKIKSNKGRDIPEAEEQMKPSSPAAAEEKELSKSSEEFVRKAPEETVGQLSEALAADGVSKSSEKQHISEKNHTRVNKASCSADTVMEKGSDACKKMIQHLHAVDAPLSSKSGLSSAPSASQGRSSPEPKSEPEPGSVGGIKRFSGLKSSSAQQKAEESKEESWRHICPEGDSDADIKQWLKDTSEESDSREMKYFHWYSQTADKSKDGFKPIKKSRSEHADISDTVDSMVQMYTTNTRDVAEKIFKKMAKNKGHGCKDWLLDILEESDDKEMKYFHWYSQSADKAKDGFKPIKKSRSEGADRSDTVDSMVQMYAAKTRDVTRKISEKIEKNKDNVVPEVEEQNNPSSTAAAEEKLLTRMLNDFVEKVPKETFAQLMEALMSANTLKPSEKETILQNRTRVNMASCFVDIVMEKGTDASKEVITRLQTIDPRSSSESRSPSDSDAKVKKNPFSALRLKRMLSEEQEEYWNEICPPWDKDAELKHWLKDSLENLRNKEVKYFRWYSRVAEESRDGYKPIRRCRSKHADRSDISDSSLQMYPGKVKEVTKKISEKIRTQKAQHWISDFFEESGDKESKYCQMLSQSTDKLKGGIKSMKRVPVEDGGKVDAADVMMQMYASDNREEVEKVLNESKENTDVLSDDEQPGSPSSPSAGAVKGIKGMLLDFIKKVSKDTLGRSVEVLVAKKVSSAAERKTISEENHTRVNKASCSVDLVYERGAEDCQKVIQHLQSLDPASYSELKNSQKALFKRIRSRMKEDRKAKQEDDDDDDDEDEESEEEEEDKK